MTKEEIKQKFFDVIGTKLSYSAKTDEIKDLAKAFKIVCDTEYDDSLLTELANIEQTGACKQKCNSHRQNCNKPADNDDGVFGLCD